MGIKNLVNCAYVVYLVLFFLGFQGSVEGRLLLLKKKPDRNNAAATARWLVSQNSWGVLNTISSDLGGAPFGNVVSFSDGLPDGGSGVPYFYLTTLDPTAKNALKDQRSSLTISEYTIGSCGKTDPENPTCAKITLTGKLKQVTENSKEAKFAKKALFTKHPEMAGWPQDHNFQFFSLEIEDIFLINWFGGPKPLTLDQYFHPKLSHSQFLRLKHSLTGSSSSSLIMIKALLKELVSPFRQFGGDEMMWFDKNQPNLPLLLCVLPKASWISTMLLNVPFLLLVRQLLLWLLGTGHGLLSLALN